MKVPRFRLKKIPEKSGIRVETGPFYMTTQQTLILATAVYVVNDGYVRLPGYHFVIKEPLIQVFTQGKCQPCAKVYYECASGNLVLETGSESAKIEF